MVGGYRPAELSVGVEAALERLASACRRDGYKLSANLLLTTEATGKEHAVVHIDGKWCEHGEVG